MPEGGDRTQPTVSTLGFNPGLNGAKIRWGLGWLWEIAQQSRRLMISDSQRLPRAMLSRPLPAFERGPQFRH